MNRTGRARLADDKNRPLPIRQLLPGHRINSPRKAPIKIIDRLRKVEVTLGRINDRHFDGIFRHVNTTYRPIDAPLATTENFLADTAG